MPDWYGQAADVLWSARATVMCRSAVRVAFLPGLVACCLHCDTVELAAEGDIHAVGCCLASPLFRRLRANEVLC